MQIEIVPVSKPRMTRRDKWQERPAVMAYRAFGDELRLKLPGYEVPPVVELEFRLPMPKSWSKKKMVSMDGEPHQQKPDIDNLVKSFLDHLCEDDSYVWSVKASKKWSTSGGITIKEGSDD